MACSVAEIDLCMVQGETYAKDFRWLPGGDPADLTGWTAIAHFRVQRDAPDVLLEATTENGRIVIGPEPGEYGFRLSPDITRSLRRCVYDLFLIAPDGSRRAHQRGRVEYERAVTRTEA